MSKKIEVLLGTLIAVILLVAGLSWLGNSSDAQSIDCTPARAAAGKCQLSATPMTTVSPASTASATTVPSTTAAPTSAAPTTVTPATTTQPACVDHVVQNKETYFMGPLCHAKGDVQVSANQSGPFTALYDSDPNSGLIVSCVNGCWLYAEWGANISPRSVDDLKSEMLKTGCGPNGCATVNVVTWPTSQSTPSASTPAPTTVPTVDVCDPSIPKGSKMFIRGDGHCVVSGDVAVSNSENGPWKVLYDSDQSTGLVVVVTHDAWVFAPYGASVTGADPKDVADAVKATGCGLPNGCAKVITVTV